MLVALNHKTEYRTDTRHIVSCNGRCPPLRPTGRKGEYVAGVRFPVNSYEAESRRIARFRHMGHTPGDIDPPPEEPAGEYPFTLDLRWMSGCL